MLSFFYRLTLGILLSSALASAAYSQSSSTLRLRSSRHLEEAAVKQEAGNQKVFGTYRLHIGAAKPDLEEQKNYEENYGSTPYYPFLGVDYFFFDWYATLGLTIRGGYYKDEGNAIFGPNDRDQSEDVEITIIPLQIGAIFEMTPFQQKWLVLSGWFGYEYDFLQEVRVDSGSGSESSAATDAEDASSDESTRPFVSSQNRDATFFGGSVSFLISGLDPQVSHSLGTMGLRAIYLSPFFEVVTKLNKSDYNFARSVFGLAFTFESI